MIVRYGTPATQRTVTLVVNGKTTATKTMAVPANGKATVEFPALEVPYGFSRCEVRIDSADGFPADDLRRFAVQRSDPQKGAAGSVDYGDSRSRRSTSAQRSRRPPNRPSSSNLLTSTRPLTASRPTTLSSFFPMSTLCLRCWRIRSPATYAPEAVFLIAAITSACRALANPHLRRAHY